MEKSPSTKGSLLSEDSLSDNATRRLKYSLGLLSDPSHLPPEQLGPQHSLGINQVNLQVDANSSVAADSPDTFAAVTNPIFEEETAPRTASDSDKSDYLPLLLPGAPGAKTTAGRPVFNSAQREDTQDSAIKSDVDKTLPIKPAVAPDSFQNMVITANGAPCMLEKDAIRAAMHSDGVEPVSTKEHIDGAQPVSTRELKTPQSAALASPGPLAEPGNTRQEALPLQQASSPLFDLLGYHQALPACFYDICNLLPQVLNPSVFPWHQHERVVDMQATQPVSLVLDYWLGCRGDFEGPCAACCGYTSTMSFLQVTTPVLDSTSLLCACTAYLQLAGCYSTAVGDICWL